MADEFRYPRKGDHITTKFGTKGIVLGMASRPEPFKPWKWEGRHLPGGPYVVLLEGGTVTGLAFDEVRLA